MKKLQRPLSETEKKVVMYLKKIDKIVGECGNDFRAELFGQAGAYLVMVLFSSKEGEVINEMEDGDTIRKDCCAWKSNYIHGNGGDADFEQ